MHCRLFTPPLFVEMEKCRAVQPEEGTASSTVMLKLLSRYIRQSKWLFLAARCKQFSPCKRKIVAKVTVTNINFITYVLVGGK